MTGNTLEQGLPPELAAKWKHMTERHITREYRAATFTEHECRLIEAALRLPAGADCPKRLLGWRTGDYLYETTDRSQAINWLGNVEVLPIFEGDPNTKLSAAPRHEPGN